MSSLYSHVRSAVAAVPWLVYPQVMDVVVEVLARRLEGQRLSDEEVAERIANAERRAGPRRGSARAGGGSVAVIPVYGILAHRAEFFADTSSSGTSVMALQRSFREVMADDSVGSILFDVDSPGGQAAGVPELAAEIRAARGQKPMAAISNAFMASGAYYIASAVDEIVVTPSSLTGSVGVVMAHVDETVLEEKMGLKTTLIYAGEHKVETYPESPLTDDARAHLQSLVDDMYAQFTGDVGRGRGISAAQVKADYGKGRVMTAREAVKAGMVDRIDTFEGAIARLAEGKVRPRGAQALGGVDVQLVVPETSTTTTAIAAGDMEATAAGASGGEAGTLDELALERAIAGRRVR